MFNRTTIAAVVVLAVLSLLGVNANATTYYWDVNGTTAGFGTAGGTWGTDTYWSTNASGTITTSLVTSTTNDALNFGTATAGLAAGTVSVTGNQYINSITFGAASGAIVVSSGTITFGGASPTVTVNNGSDTLSSLITGTAGLIKSGTGTLILTNTGSNYTGGTTVNGGQITANAGVQNLATSGIFGTRTSTNVITVNNGGKIVGNGNNALGYTAETSAASTYSWVINTGGVVANSAATAANAQGYSTGLGNLTLNGGTLAVYNAWNTSGAYTLIGDVTVATAASDIHLYGSGTGNFAPIINLVGTRTFNVASTGGSPDLSVSAPLGSTGGITKIGAGTMLLSGSSTYSGGTIISAGTVNVSNSYGLGSGTVTNNGVLNLTVAASSTYQIGAVSGSGTINISNIGTGSASTLSNGSYSGFTGVLNIGVGAATGAGKVQMNGADNASATINVLTNATMHVTGSVTKNATLNLAGGDTGETLGQLRLEGNANWAGAINLTGAITGSGDYTFGSNSGTGYITGAISGGSLAVSKGGTGTIVISNTANSWTGGTLSGSGVLQFTQAGALPQYGTAGKVTFNGGTLAVSVSGASGWTTSQIDTLLSAATKTSGYLGLDTTSGDLTQWTAFTTTNLGTLGINKLGANDLILNQANTYSGGTYITSGTVQVTTSDTALGTGTVTLNGGVLQAGDTGRNFANNVSVTSTGGTIDTQANNLTISGSIAGGTTGLLTKAGAGTLTLTKTANLRTLTLNAGTIDLSSDLVLSNTGGVSLQGTGGSITSTSGTGRIVLNSGGALNYMDWKTTNGTTISAQITGAYGIDFYNSGTITLTNTANNFTGSVDLFGTAVSTPQIGMAGAASTLGMSSSIVFGNGTNTSALIYTGAGETTDKLIVFGGSTAGGTIDQSGSGLLNFSNAGTLTVTNTNTGAKTLTLQGSTAGTGQIAGSIVNSSSGATSLVKTGTGKWTLSGSSSYSGGTTLSGGILQVANDNALGTGTVTTSGTSCLQLNGVTISNPITMGATAGLLNASNIEATGGSASQLTGLITLGTGSSIKIPSTGFDPNADNSTLRISGGVTGTQPLYLYADAANSSITVDTTPINIGTAQLSGKNLYINVAGNTAGTLAAQYNGTVYLGVDNAFTGAPALIVGNANSLSTLDLQGHAQTFVSITASSTGSYVNSDIITSSGTGTGSLIVSNTGASSYAGVIAGSLNLTKSNSATLTLSNTGNTYTGKTTVTGGALSIANDLMLGTAPVTAVDDQLTLNGGTLQVTASTTLAANRGVTLGSSGGTFNISNANTMLTVNSVITGTGNLTKTGVGRLYPTVANDFVGGIFLNSGTLNVNNGDGVLGNTANDITYTGNASLQRTVAGTTTLDAGRTITINSGITGTIDVGTAFGMTVNGLITGSGTLAKTSAGTLTLSASNSYTGGTIITAGTVNFVSGGLGSTGAISMNGGTLQWGTGVTTDLSSRLAMVAAKTATLDTNGNNVTLANSFGGGTTGILAKTGAGNLTLSSSNSHTGGTNLAAGTLLLGDDNALGTGTLTITGGATLASVGSAARNLANASSMSGSVYFGNASNTGALTLGGTATLTGGTTLYTVASSTLTFGGDIANGGNGLTIGGDHNTTVINGTLGVGATPTGGLTISTTAGTVILNGNNLFTGNVSLSLPNGIGESNVSSLILTNSGALGVGPKSVSSGGGSKIYLQNNITLPSGINFSVTGDALWNDWGNNTITGNITMQSGDGSTFIHSNTGTLTILGSVTANATGRMLNAYGAGNIVINGVIGNGSTVDLPLSYGSGGGDTREVTTGTLTLGGSNTFTGATNIYAGTLKIGHVKALASSSGVVISSTGTLDVAGFAASIKELSGSGTINNSTGNGVLTINAAAADTFSGVIQNTGGSLALVKAGTGSLMLNGNSTYSGGTTISAGVLNVQSNSALGTGKILISGAGAQLQLEGGVTLANSTTISSTSGSSGYIYNVSGTNTLSGPIKMTAAAAIYFTSAAGQLNLTGTLDTGTHSVYYQGDGDIAVSNAALYYNLFKTGNGTLTLGGNNAFVASPGNVSLQGGTLKINDANAMTNANSVAISSGATLDLNGFSQSIKNLSGSTGTPIIDNSSGSAVTLTVSNTGTFTFAGAIGNSGGALALTKTGAGTLNLTGNNTYSGDTNINGGNLKVNGSLKNTGNVIVSSGGTLSGTGSVGNVTVNSSGILAAGNSVGAQTMATMVLSAGSLLEVEFNNTPANDQWIVTGTDGLTISGGTLKLWNEGTTNTFSTNGTYNLIQYAGNIGGTGISALSIDPSTSLAPSKTYTFGTSGGWVTLNIADGYTTAILALSNSTAHLNMLKNGTIDLSAYVKNDSGAIGDDMTYTLTGDITGSGTLAHGVGEMTAKAYSQANYGSFSLSVTANAANVHLSDAITAQNFGMTIVAGEATAGNGVFVDANALYSKVASGGSYANLASKVTAGPVGKLGSEAIITAGTAGTDRLVSMNWRTRTADELSQPSVSLPADAYNLISDVVQLSGASPDTVSLKVSYDEGSLVLGRFNETQLVGYNAIYLAELVGGKWTRVAGGQTVDTVNNTVTATGLTDGTYAVVPEPGTMALLLVGGIGVLLRRRRKA